MHSLKVLQLSSAFDCHPFPSVNLKSFNGNRKTQQQNVMWKTAFYFVSTEGIDTAIPYRELAICFIDKAHVTKMQKTEFFTSRLDFVI